MGERRRGKDTYLEARLFGTGNWIDLTDTLRGLDGISVNQVEDSREVGGGGGKVGVQFLGYQAGVSRLVIDVNITNIALFWMKIGRRFEFRYGPLGKASGNPRWYWQSISVPQINFQPRGVGRFSVVNNHDGLIDKTQVWE